MNIFEFLNKEFLLNNKFLQIYWVDDNNIYQGCNELHANFLAISSPEKIIGKQTKDLLCFKDYPKLAHVIDTNNKEVIKTGIQQVFDEKFILNGEELIYTSQKSPLLDSKKNIIGVITFLINITDRKFKDNNLDAFQLTKIANVVPFAFYWKDLNHKFLGANRIALEYVGLTNKDIGKTDLEIWPEQYARNFMIDDKTVIQEKKAIIKEDKYTDIHGNIKYCNVIKSPLYDENDNIKFILGVSLDITAEKEIEKLKLENLKLQIKSQEEFRKLVGQMIHDIQSPLASMRMFMHSATDIPEKDRTLLRCITDRIGEITQDLLNNYKPTNKLLPEQEQLEPLLISTTLSKVISEKRYEYKNSNINFILETHNNDTNQFAFINTGAGNFKRMISNLINNSVESFLNYDVQNIITIKYQTINQQVNISIQDNGKGIPEELLIKLQNGLAVTQDKPNGQGLGLMQVQNTVNSSGGIFHIISSTGENHGTTINLGFPEIEIPEWFTKEIILNKNDTIIVLDDDPSIHGAWDTKLATTLEQNPTLKVMHFVNCLDLFNYLNPLSETERNNFYLLSDYELLKQPTNGLEVIRLSKIQRATLVTSHYANSSIINIAQQQNVKILPKELVQIVAIGVYK